MESLAHLRSSGVDACLLLIGGGDHVEWLRKKVRSLGLEEFCEVRGHVNDPADLAAAYDTADVFLPALTDRRVCRAPWSRPWPMDCHRSAARSGGFLELLPAQLYLRDPSPDLVARTLKALLCEPDRYTEASQGALHTARGVPVSRLHRSGWSTSSRRSFVVERKHPDDPRVCGTASGRAPGTLSAVDGALGPGQSRSAAGVAFHYEASTISLTTTAALALTICALCLYVIAKTSSRSLWSFPAVSLIALMIFHVGALPEFLYTDTSSVPFVERFIHRPESATAIWISLICINAYALGCVVASGRHNPATPLLTPHRPRSCGRRSPKWEA